MKVVRCLHPPSGGTAFPLLLASARSAIEAASPDWQLVMIAPREEGQVTFDNPGPVGWLAWKVGNAAPPGRRARHGLGP